jgi:flagellar biosynthetic protein FliQ
MTEGQVLEVGRQALWVLVQVALPVLIFGMVAGVLVSLFQAVTQIQEVTLTFVPKIAAVVVALIVIFGPWMLATMVAFMVQLLLVCAAVSDGSHLGKYAAVLGVSGGAVSRGRADGDRAGVR